MSMPGTERERQRDMKREIARWLDSELSSNNCSYVFVTLTAKQSVLNVDGNLIATTRDDMDREVGKFLNRLDVAVYGNAARRFGKRLCRIDASHGGAGSFQRLHRHLIIELPEQFEGDIGLNQFADLVRMAWSKSPYAREIIDVSQTRSVHGSIRYLVKGGGADNLALSNIVL